MDKTCLCGAPMRIVTSDRGFVTYSCTRGCNYYLSEETKAEQLEAHYDDSKPIYDSQRR